MFFWLPEGAISRTRHLAAKHLDKPREGDGYHATAPPHQREVTFDLFIPKYAEIATPLTNLTNRITARGGYSSRLLTPPERNYSTTEREALALV
ncbi:hypothetical protein Zmor_026116 [Zophobas morio]|uniref:Uncharacterized protein n=1 Tax=Zophobas morio TaxID=2755281 RepID=A0AA38M4V4_9CUCU|nr:hypothetical protein Zmor_026116 [Zophobas morio]